jgi:hypothetical protein
MQVKIYKPAKTAMQSGTANTKKWLLEPEVEDRQDPDRLIGWVGSEDTTRQIRMRFDTKEEAVAFAEKQGWRYTVYEPKERRIRPKSYADNFRHDRIGRWTH